MAKELSHFSWEMLDSIEARGERHNSDQSSHTAVVQRLEYFDVLVSKMEKVDPQGAKAHEIASKYYKVKE